MSVPRPELDPRLFMEEALRETRKPHRRFTDPKVALSTERGHAGAIVAELKPGREQHWDVSNANEAENQSAKPHDAGSVVENNSGNAAAETEHKRGNVSQHRRPDASAHQEIRS